MENLTDEQRAIIRRYQVAQAGIRRMQMVNVANATPERLFELDVQARRADIELAAAKAAYDRLVEKMAAPPPSEMHMFKMRNGKVRI